MTEDRALYTDDAGGTLSLSEANRLTVLDVDEFTKSSVTIPQRVADAIRTALAVTDDYTIVAFGPEAVLADIKPLLDQCDREDKNPRPARRGLYTSEIRMALRQPVPCGHAPQELYGARCGRPGGVDHGSWHVDPERSLRWRFADPDADPDAAFSGALDVRGWSPEETYEAPEGAPLMTEHEEVVRTVAVLDRHGAPSALTAAECAEFLRSRDLLGPIPARIMRQVAETRQAEAKS